MTKRSDGLVEVTLQIGYNDQGRRVIKHFYGHSKAEAMRKRDEYKAGIDNGVKERSASFTVAQWIEEYESVYGKLSSNANKNRIIEHIGKMRITSVGEIDCQRLLNAYSGMSYSLLSKLKVDVRRIFKKARLNHIIVFDPAECVTLPDCKEGSHRSLEKWEISAILHNYNADPFGIPVLTMLLCGLRRGELIALMWDCVDLENNVIHIRRSQRLMEDGTSYIFDGAKTEAGVRDIPIVPALKKALESMQRSSENDFVFKGKNGDDMSPAAFLRYLNKFCETMSSITGQEFKLRSHDLRHTYCTGLYDAGIDVKTAQAWLGHADINMTLSIYTHLSKGRKESEAEKLSSRLFVDCS